MMADDRFYQGSVLGKLFGQVGSLANLGAVVMLLTGEVISALVLFGGGTVLMYIGYKLSGGASNPHLYD
jgi:hypothetical protein